MTSPAVGTSRVGVVTDSTAYLSAEQVAASGVEVVPLEVVLGGTAHAEADVDPATLAAALRRWTPVSTSRPAPAAMLAAYERLVERGCTDVVSVHLSGDVSGTCASARLAARSCVVPVTVVDSRQLAMGLGYAVLAAAAAAAAGSSAAEVARAADERAAATRGVFCVDTLEHLRRGGRIGTAAALIGTALAVKPLLHVVDGRIEPLERVRTSARALARLLDLVVEAAPAGSRVEVTVHHLEARRRADDLAGRVAERLGDRLVGGVPVVELGAVVGAHVGPGTLAVAVAPALYPPDRA